MPFAGAGRPVRDRRRPTRRLLGSISLLRIAWEHQRAEVGYWLAREARGQGHATRAVRLICAWGFAALGLERIDLLAATGNRASQRRGRAQRLHPRGGPALLLPAGCERQDMVCFGLLASDPAGYPVELPPDPSAPV